MPGGGPIPLIVPKEGRLILRVLDLRQIAVVVIGELRLPFEGIGELLDPIHSIVLDQGPIAEGSVIWVMRPSTSFQ